MLLATSDTEEIERFLLDRRWPGDDGERIVGRDCGGDGVARHRREIGEQRAEAVDRQSVLSETLVCLVTAAGERCACATTLARSGSAACLSVSSNSIGARR